MARLSTESTPRERLQRLLALMRRARRFRKGIAACVVVGLAVVLVVTLQTKRIYRSETTVLYREGLPTQAAEGESAAARAARLGPRLKDLLYARPKLEQLIDERNLFPEKRRRSMMDAVEEMTTAIGFRARASDSYVISFLYDDPVVARDVVQELADQMIETHNQQNLDTATLTRDFLKKKQAEAEAAVDEASRRLAQFLADHPQFQWGVNDSPYAPAPGPAPALPGLPPRLGAPVAPSDPALAALERDLARVEGELYPGQRGRGVAASPLLAEATKQRDAAAAELRAAHKALAEKLATVKPAHPDAIAAQARVDAARRALAAAEETVASLGHANEPPPAASRGGPSPSRRAELERSRASLQRQIEARRATLVRAAGGASDAAHTSPEDERETVELETEWHHLRSELERARATLGTIQQTSRSADLSADAVAKQGHAEMTILEPAYLPTRPDRGRGRVFFIGTAVVLFLALGYASARVLADDTIFDEGDVVAIDGPKVLAAVPHLEPMPPPPPERAIIPAVHREEDPEGDDDPPLAPTSAPPVVSQRGMVLVSNQAIVEAVFEDPDVEVIGAAPPCDPGELAPAPPRALAALRVLRHRLEQRRGDGSYVVVVMSPSYGEGKTTLAVRLAMTLSEADRARVVLVEGNFERPRLASTLGLKLPPEAGFSQQISGRIRGNAAPWGVVRIGSSLSILGEPGEVAAFPNLIHNPNVEAALVALRRSYEYVVVDGPAVMGSGDANVLETAADGVLLLVRTGRTQGADLSRATRLLGDGKVLGVVLNDVFEEAPKPNGMRPRPRRDERDPPAQTG